MARTGPTEDPHEVAFFAQLGESWWDPSGPMRALHQINPVRVAWLCDCAARRLPAQDARRRDPSDPAPLAGLDILDIGCGAGILCEPLARLGARITGIDPSERNIEVARAHAEGAGLAIDYRCANLERLAADGAQFDMVLAMEVVEHVPNVRQFVRGACALARADGIFAASTLNRTFKSFALGIVAAEYILRWLPRGSHRWDRFVTPAEFADALAPCGFRIAAQTGVVYDALRNRWRLSRNMDVNYMLAARRE